MSNKDTQMEEDNSDVFFTDINAYKALHMGENLLKARKEHEALSDQKPAKLREWFSKRKPKPDDVRKRNEAKEEWAYQFDEAVEQWYLE